MHSEFNPHTALNVTLTEKGARSLILAWATTLFAAKAASAEPYQSLSTAVHEVEAIVAELLATDGMVFKPTH